MTGPASSSPGGLSRRRALQMLAASGGAVAGSSLIVSRPALADSGSPSCRYEFSSAVVNVTAYNTEFVDDGVFVSMAIGGSCPCDSPVPTLVEYAFFVDAPNGSLTSGAWSTSPAFNRLGVDLWPAPGGDVTVTAGVRVTCGTGPSATVRCRFNRATFTMPPAPRIIFGRTFELDTDNGTSTAFQEVPLCSAAAGLQFSSLSASSPLMMQPGPGAIPPEVQAELDGRTSRSSRPPVDLVEPAPVDGTPIEPASPATTTSSTTTTTTQPATPTTTSTTSTTTTSTTTTSSSTTTTSTP